VNPIDLLLNRNSAARLTDPAPTGAAREQIFRAALRAPDHGRLRPWRFLVVEGEDRGRFGDLMAEVTALDDPGMDAAARARVRDKALRAPLLVLVAARLQAHPKIPEIEQLLSAGCAALNMLLAAEALGFGGMWRSGAVIYRPETLRGLGLDPERERLVGVLYLGTVLGERKPLPEEDPADYFSTWPPA
jgi:nitroreductase